MDLRRVAIAEDQPILREGLVSLLRSRGIEAVGFGDGRALLAALQADDLPDVVVLDIRMPPTFTDEGLVAAATLRGRFPRLPVLLFSQYVQANHAAALLAGDCAGLGYLLKDRVSNSEAFLGSLRRLVAGETVLDPQVVTQMARSRLADTDPGLANLTPRESQVLALMAEGRSNAAIGEELYLSQGAVEKNIASIFAKLDLTSDSAANRRVLAVRRFLRL